MPLLFTAKGMSDVMFKQCTGTSYSSYVATETALLLLLLVDEDY